MRRVKIRYKSFIYFPDLYIPPNMLGPECNTQQLTLMEGLYIPKPGVLLDLAEQLDNLRMASPTPKASNLKSGDKHGTKDETPKRSDQETLGRLQGNITSPVRRRVSQSIAQLRSLLPHHPMSMTWTLRPTG